MRHKVSLTLRRILMLGLFGSGLLAWSCSSVPLTGRSQLLLVSEQSMQQLGSSQYREVIAMGPLSSDVARTEELREVGRRISAAVEAYARQIGQPELTSGFAWEFNLIESEQVNAWCLPGGKVAFYTGILPVCQGVDGIAVVMGHEVAHALARHGSERASQALLQQAGALTLEAFLIGQTEESSELYRLAYGVGTQYGALLPFSRAHESEADRLGLIFMAMAGYDPREAPLFWKRMSANSGEKPPEWASTHPSDQKRVADLERYMAEALPYYKP